MVPFITPSAHTAFAELVSSLGSDSLQPPGDGGLTHWPTAEQVWPASQAPHTLPHPSSPHCLPSHLGVQPPGSLPPEPAPPELPPEPAPPPEPPPGSGAPPFAAMNGSIHAAERSTRVELP